MDYMASGSRYTPKVNGQFESVQFLPATDNRKLEKQKGPSKVGAVVGVLIFIAVIALMTGLLVWHFHFRKNDWNKRMYTGSMKITDQAFENAYENSNSSEFKALAKQVLTQLKYIYSQTPQLKKYYVGSTVQAFSEGSVIAYYLSEFRVPVGQEASVDGAMEKLGSGARSSISPPLRVEKVVASAIDARMLSRFYQRQSVYEKHLRPNAVEVIQSPGFPNSPYTPNTFIQWQLRADPGNVIKLEFDAMNLEDNCTNDFVKIYDSLVMMENNIMEELCGRYPSNEKLSFLSSRNVMLLTMATNQDKNYPGFRAKTSQVPVGSSRSCGGSLSGSGSFSSPNFPNHYPPQVDCEWVIQAPKGKVVKVTFKTILLAEPGHKNNPNCQKDYVELNNKKICGEYLDTVLTETSKTNTMKVVFHSDASYVDQGFTAEFEAVDSNDPCPDMFQCKNLNCMKSSLRCDGWNDCGDMSDETDCKCSSDMISCKNGLCKPKFWLCDGVDDCGDSTDEMNCGGCKSGEFTCVNKKCVSEKQKCDGNNDCGDGSDELNCARDSRVSCTDLTYKCKNNNCISKVNPECDGTRDCDDGSDEENCDCGKKINQRSRIVGGQDADVGEFPWQVSLQVQPYGHVCGASIISPKWLVTAAHCVQDDHTNNIRFSQPGTWKAYLGLHTQGQTGSPAVMRNLKQIKPHPYYNTQTFDNDMALMELDSPVTYSDYIRPICLPAPQHDFKVGSEVWISGWGATREGGSAAKVLQKASVRIINHAVCDGLMAGQLTSRMLCAGVLAGGVDACQGDSGGPLSSPENDRMFLAGVVSWGDGCARRNKPGIYTTVTKFRGWIKEQTGV